MLPALIALQVLTLIALLVLLLRKPASAQEPDPRLAQLLAADLPKQINLLDGRSDTLDKHLREQIESLKKSEADDAQRSREAAEKSSASLRKEVQDSIQGLGLTLRTGLDGLRSDNKTDSDRLRTTVEGRLDKLSANNEKKLEEMRLTVDEKLQKTLHSRLTESFSAVTDQLNRVHAGLGEMSNLAVGVGDLKKVLSGVKSRGILGEDFLRDQLEQMFTVDQYIKNARIKSGSLESVEYALKIPNGPDSIVLLSVDSKFPNEDWERLQHAEDSGNDDERKKAGAAFERAILAQGKKICEKYIDPPNTLPFAVMYLPTEALAAEVMRRPGLHSEMRTKYQVLVTGPANFAMMLSTFKLVFRTHKFEKNLTEVWKVFQQAQSEFEKFGGQIEKVVTQVGTVQNTLKEISGKTKTVNRALQNVSKIELLDSSASSLPASAQAGFDGFLPTLAANQEDADKDDGPPQ